MSLSMSLPLKRAGKDSKTGNQVNVYATKSEPKRAPVGRKGKGIRLKGVKDSGEQCLQG